VKVTIVKRGDSWRWQFPVYRNGKRRFVSGTAGTKAEAQRAGAARLAELDQGRPLVSHDKNVTVEEFLCSKWVPAVRSDLRPSTWAGYENLFRVRVVPRIGGVRLVDLDTGAVEQLKADLLCSGGPHGEGLSPQSVKNTVRTLSRALRDAVAWGYVAHNAAASVRSLRLDHKREMATWSAAQVREFLDGLGDDPLAPVFALALSSGLRRGELGALRWADVDLERGQLSVRRARVAVGYEVHEGAPKSGRARTVALGSGTVAALRAHKSRQLEASLAFGLPRPTLVLTREDCYPMHPQSLTRHFDEAVKASGLPRIRFHDCRHTAATLLLEAGEHPKVVQERLGHSSIQITLDTYSHVSEGMQERAAGLIDDAVYGTSHRPAPRAKTRTRNRNKASSTVAAAYSFSPSVVDEQKGAPPDLAGRGYPRCRPDTGRAQLSASRR
jgi:integrase